MSFILNSIGQRVINYMWENPIKVCVVIMALAIPIIFTGDNEVRSNVIQAPLVRGRESNRKELMDAINGSAAEWKKFADGVNWGSNSFTDQDLEEAMILARENNWRSRAGTIGEFLDFRRVPDAIDLAPSAPAWNPLMGDRGRKPVREGLKVCGLGRESNRKELMDAINGSAAEWKKFADGVNWGSSSFTEQDLKDAMILARENSWGSRIEGIKAHLDTRSVLAVDIPKIGKREGINVRNSSITALRPIKGDGDCFYRAVMFGNLERIAGQGDYEKRKSCQALTEIIRNCRTIEVQVKDDFIQWLNADGGRTSLEKLEGVIGNDSFNEDMITIARHLTNEVVLKEGETVVQGVSLSKLIYIECQDRLAELVDMDLFLTHGVAVSDSVVELGLLGKALGVNIDVFTKQDDELVRKDTTKVNFDRCAIAVLWEGNHYNLLS